MGDVFLGFARLNSRTPTRACVRGAKRNRSDPHWGGIGRLRIGTLAVNTTPKLTLAYLQGSGETTGGRPSIRFHSAPRTYDAPPWGVRVATSRNQGKNPTRTTLPLFFPITDRPPGLTHTGVMPLMGQSSVTLNTKLCEALQTNKSGGIFRVGIFPDFVRPTIRTPPYAP